ncbi:hypothetical protein [Ureibacillus sp. FSL E2-3493]|uniref:hypothetical protein n=1 Tax=Ureibacillus sp. FSL E2-3493 TaxID=2921367 RepID=UPI00311A4188
MEFTEQDVDKAVSVALAEIEADFKKQLKDIQDGNYKSDIPNYKKMYEEAQGKLKQIEEQKTRKASEDKAIKILTDAKTFNKDALYLIRQANDPVKVANYIVELQRQTKIEETLKGAIR